MDRLSEVRWQLMQMAAEAVYAGSDMNPTDVKRWVYWMLELDEDEASSISWSTDNEDGLSSEDPVYSSSEDAVHA